MHYHIILTDQCNSECRYCYQKSVKDADSDLHDVFWFDFSAPSRSHVDVKKLKQFLERDKNPVLIFYGGEPLLEIEKIKEIMGTLDVPFRMQTNGLLLDRLPFEYVNRIQKILVSIDGSQERTDFNRGKGTYNKVMGNLSLIRKNGYTGEIIARMTIAQDFPDIYKQVLSLLKDGFTSVHWQLDAGFYASDFDAEQFKSFVKEYNKSITDLVNYWIKEMKNGYVLKLYPFAGIISSLLKNEKTKLRCGAGHSGYAIMTNGKIIACPIMNYIEDFVAGTLDSDPQTLRTFDVSGRCVHCHIASICGGRCLYWNKAKVWPEEGDNLICETVEHLIFTLRDTLPDIEKLIKEGTITLENFEYEKYFGPEIIP